MAFSLQAKFCFFFPEGFLVTFFWTFLGDTPEGWLSGVFANRCFPQAKLQKRGTQEPGAVASFLAKLPPPLMVWLWPCFRRIALFVQHSSHFTLFFSSILRA